MVANCSCIDMRAKYPTPYSFEFDGGREVASNRELFEGNSIKTSKYTWYNFLPSNSPDT